MWVAPCLSSGGRTIAHTLMALVGTASSHLPALPAQGDVPAVTAQPQGLSCPMNQHQNPAGGHWGLGFPAKSRVMALCCWGQWSCVTNKSLMVKGVPGEGPLPLSSPVPAGRPKVSLIPACDLTVWLSSHPVCQKLREEPWLLGCDTLWESLCSLPASHSLSSALWPCSLWEGMEKGCASLWVSLMIINRWQTVLALGEVSWVVVGCLESGMECLRCQQPHRVPQRHGRS